MKYLAVKGKNNVSNTVWRLVLVDITESGPSRVRWIDIPVTERRAVKRIARQLNHQEAWKPQP